MSTKRFARTVVAAALATGLLVGATACGQGGGNGIVPQGSAEQTGSRQEPQPEASKQADPDPKATSSSEPEPKATHEAEPEATQPAEPEPKATAQEDPGDSGAKSGSTVVWTKDGRTVSFKGPKGWTPQKYSAFDGDFRNRKGRMYMRIRVSDGVDLTGAMKKAVAQLKQWAKVGDPVGQHITRPGGSKHMAVRIAYEFQDQDTGETMEGAYWIAGPAIVIADMWAPKGQLEDNEHFVLEALQNFQDSDNLIDPPR